MPNFSAFSRRSGVCILSSFFVSFEYKELAQDVVYDDYENSVCKLDDKQIGHVKAKYGEHDGLARDAGNVFAKHDKKSESSEFEYEKCRDPGCGECNELFDDAAVVVNQNKWSARAFFVLRL